MKTVLAPHIVSVPNMRFGKPTIEGTRIAVEDVALWYIEHSLPLEEICRDFQLSPAEVYAALAYYYDHQQEIDERVAREEAFKLAEREKQKSPLMDLLRERGLLR